jgi:uncharacterized protein (TIRG00374 family)
VIATLQNADWKLIPLGSLLIVLTWGIFAVRWRVLLAPVASVGWLDTFSYIMIGYLGNAVLPLRLGDVARVTLMSRKHGINIGFTSATGMLEKLLDVLTVVALAGFLMLVVPIPELIRRGVQAATVTTIGAFAALVLLARSQTALVRLESFLSSYLPPGVLELVFGILRKFAQGLQITRSLGQMLKLSLLSLLSWGIASLSIWCYVRAFQLTIPWQAAALVLVVTNLGGAIPSSPGAIGVYEFLMMLALSVWLPDQSEALGCATVTHAINLGLSVVLGLVAAWRGGVQLSTLTPGSPVAREGDVESTWPKPIVLGED